MSSRPPLSGWSSLSRRLHPFRGSNLAYSIGTPPGCWNASPKPRSGPSFWAFDRSIAPRHHRCARTIRPRSRRRQRHDLSRRRFPGARARGQSRRVAGRAAKDSGWIEFPFTVETPDGMEPRRAWAYHTQLDFGAVLLVGRDIEAMRRFAGMIRRLLIALVITIVLGIAGGLLMSRNFLRRVDAITAASRSIIHGDLSGPFRSRDRRRARPAVGRLNEMLDQIQRLMPACARSPARTPTIFAPPGAPPGPRRGRALQPGSPKPADDEKDHRRGRSPSATFNALLWIANAESGQPREGLQ